MIFGAILAHLSRDAPPSSIEASRPDSIARNTGFAFGISMMSAAFTAVLTLFLLRALGSDDYGVFALAMSIGGLVALGSNLGISSSAARFVAETRQDRIAVHGIVSDALRLKVSVSGLISLALVALAGPISVAYESPALEWPLRILSLGLFGESLVAFFSHLAEAEGRISSFLRVTALESSVETFASIALVLAGFSVSGAMAGRAGGYLFAAGFAYVLFARNLNSRPRLVGKGAGNTKRILRYGSAMFIVDGAFVLFGSIDVLLIGWIIDVSAVGQFQAPLKLTVFLGIAGAAVASGVSPRLTRRADQADKRAFDSALRHLMLLQGIVLAPLIVWATPLTLLLLGNDYEQSPSVMRALAPYAFLIAVSPVIAQGVNYLGEARLRVPIALGALLVNLLFDLIMLPRIGIVAGAIGTDIAYSLYVLAHLWICRRLIGTPIRPLGSVLIRVLASAAAMGLVLFAFGTGQMTIPRLVIGGALGSAAYLGALLVTRALTMAELRRAVAVVGSRVPRPAR